MIKKFREKNIIVIGDLMLDKYIFGAVERISPEAPVPILKVRKEKFIPGGAANAAHNISTLSGNSYLFGIVGNDTSKDILLEESKKSLINTEGVFVDAAKPTIQKIRVIGQNQQLLRIDYEDTSYINDTHSSSILESMQKISRIDCIIVSDYAKGTITAKLMAGLVQYSRKNKVPLIVDPKPGHMQYYKGCTMITPNTKETEEMVGFEISSKEGLEKAGGILMKELGCDVLITTGEKGMSLFQENSVTHIPTVAKEVFDVSGAGDTVIAALALSLASGASLKESAILANSAAGIKVAKLGTAPVTLRELENAESHIS